MFSRLIVILATVTLAMTAQGVQNQGQGGQGGNQQGQGGSSSSSSSSSGGHSSSSSSSGGGQQGSSSSGGGQQGSSSSGGGQQGSSSSGGGQQGSSSGASSSSSSGGKQQGSSSGASSSSSSGGNHNGSSSGSSSSSGGGAPPAQGGSSSSSSGGEHGSSSSSSGGKGGSSSSSGGNHNGSSSGGENGSSSGGNHNGSSSSGGKGGSSSGGENGSSSGGNHNGSSSGGEHGSSSGGKNGSSSGGENGSSSGGNHNGSSSGGKDCGSSSGETGSSSGGDNSGSSSSSGGDTSTPAPQEPQKKAELKFKWQPVFYLDLDMGQKITNLTLTNPGMAASLAPANTLVVDDYKGGLRVERYSLIEGGIGASGVWWYEGASDYRNNLTAFVGLIPMKGTQVQSVQYVNSRSEIADLPTVSHVPSAATLSTWATGNSVNYMSEGGLIFFAGFNYFHFGPTVTAVAEGTWATYVQKNGNEQAYVKITKSKMKSLALSFSGPLVSVGVSEFKDQDQAFSFLVNLSTDTGRHAYEDLVKGNVGAIQSLSMTNPQDVQFVEQDQISNQGKFRNFFFGLPIIGNISFSSGNIASFAQEDIALNQTKASVNYGIYTKDQRSKFFNVHTDKTQTFVGTAYSITDKNNQVSKGYFGQYTVDMGDEHSTQNDIRRFMTTVLQKSGLKAEIMVNVPKVEGNNYGYADAHLDVIFSQTQTDRLMDMAGRNGMNNFIASQVMNADRYFSNDTDVWNLCPSTAGEYADCMAQVKEQTYQALSSMWTQLAIMSANKSNPAAFTAAYAKFGQGVVTNAFTLQAAMALAGEGVEIYYRLEGERISLYEMYLATTTTAGQFQIMSAPGQALPVNAPVVRADRNRGIIVAPKDPIYPPIMN